MKRFLLFLVHWYQYSFSHDHKAGASGFCKYTPSCSEYCKICLEKYPLPKALLKSIWRILRCNPFLKGGIDLP